MNDRNEKIVIKFVVSEDRKDVSTEFSPNCSEADLMATAGVLLQIVSELSGVPFKKVAKHFNKMQKAKN